MSASTRDTAAPPRPRRSVLFMPGSNPRAMEKARSLPADTLVFDLEDAVAPDAKSEARRLLAAAVQRGGFSPRELIVRVNSLDSPWGEADLQLASRLPVDGVLLPKVETEAQIRDAIKHLDANGRSPLALWVMIETPEGVLNAKALAACGGRVDCVVLGTSDLAKDLRLPVDEQRLGLTASLSWCVLAARAAGADVLDGVQLDIDDDAAFRRVCEQGRRLGFDGKTLIHPRQLAAANEVFAPTRDQARLAEEVIKAWNKAASEGKGVTLVRGRLVENLHVEEARRTLALIEAIRTLEKAAD